MSRWKISIDVERDYDVEADYPIEAYLKAMEMFRNEDHVCHASWWVLEEEESDIHE